MLTLALLCKWGPPERAEFASVTKELAPTLGAEFVTVFKTALLISPETGPRFLVQREDAKVYVPVDLG